MHNLVQEIFAGVTSMIGGFVVVMIGTAIVTLTTDPGFATIIIENYGPIGVAVVVLYRKMDTLEDRVRDNEIELSDD